MLRHIFPVHSPCNKLAHPNAQRMLEELDKDDGPISLLVSPFELQSSLLFQAAVSYNSEGCIVTFVSPEPLNRIPDLVHGMPSPDPLLMKHVRMMYIHTTDQLIGFLAEVHASPVLPDVVIVQHFDYYIKQYQGENDQHHVAKLFALLKDTAAFLASKSKCSSHILISLNNYSDMIARVCRRFIRNIWKAERNQSDPVKCQMSRCKGVLDSVNSGFHSVCLQFEADNNNTNIFLTEINATEETAR